jgi:hypothetical protein
VKITTISCVINTLLDAVFAFAQFAICYLLLWVAVKATQPYWVLLSYLPNPGCSHAKTSPARKSDPVTRIGSGSL